MANALRVWWIPQVPGKPFRFDVDSLSEGVMLTRALAAYDIFQYENRIKPDYCNAGGIEMLDTDGEWCGWYDEETGEDDPEVFLNAATKSKMMEGDAMNESGQRNNSVDGGGAPKGVREALEWADRFADTASHATIPRHASALAAEVRRLAPFEIGAAAHGAVPASVALLKGARGVLERVKATARSEGFIRKFMMRGPQCLAELVHGIDEADAALAKLDAALLAHKEQP